MNHDRYGTIRRYILVSMILVPCIPLVLMLGIGYFHFTNSLAHSSMDRVRRIVSDHRQMIESFLNERRADLAFVLDTASFEELSRQENLNRIFDRLQRKSEAFADLGVFDADGVHVAYRGPYRLSGKVYSDTEWFRQVMKTGTYISDIFLGYRNVPHFVIAVARLNNGRRWAIRATIDTLRFNDLVRKVRIGKTGEAFILNRNGIFQTERRSGGDLMETDPDHTRYPAALNGTHTFIRSDSRGDQYLYATALLKNKDWRLVVRQEKADAFKALRTAAFLIVFVGMVCGGGIIAIAFVLTDRIVGRIKRTDTEKGVLQEQLIRAGRLAELGEMAAGFAHEINNPLQIMKSEQALIQTILDDLKDQGVLKASEDVSELEDSIDQIDLQIGRCAEITHAILKFGRKTEPEYREVALNQFVPEITAMIGKKAQVHGITITEDMDESTPHIFGDPSQLQQVLLNLLNNAMDAVIEAHGTAGGKLTIGIGPHGDNMAEIRVADNGSGIRPENLKKIFSPFFTTKPVGQGTGLGLSICYGIISSMEGTMTASSQPGAGTTFTIRLPAASSPRTPSNR